MATNNIQNQKIYQSAQAVPVQPENYLPTSNPQALQQNMSQCQYNGGYMPRFAPVVHNGCVYPTAVPVQSPKQGGSGNVGAVNITINGVNPPSTQPPYQPYYLPPVINNNQQPVPQPQPTQAENNKNSNALLKEKNPPKPEKEDVPKDKRHRPQEPIIELTPEYLQFLENRLKNKENVERAAAATDILKRFKESPERRNDQNLTALLNMALLDKSPTIVFTALQALESGYADGDEKTKQILENIAKNNDKFGNNLTAQGILATIRKYPNEHAKLTPQSDEQPQADLQKQA